MSAPHIVWLVTGKETYGVRQAVAQLTQGVRERGYDVAIICIQEGAFADECREMGFETHVLDVGHPPDFHGVMSAKPSELFRMWKYCRQAAPKLASLLREVSADAVHVLWPNLVSVAGRAAAQCGIPAFWEMPNYVSSRYWFGWNRWLYQSACWRYGVVPLANSASTAASLGSWPVRPTVCYLGVDSNRFNLANVRSVTRDELGIPQDAIVFEISARLIWDKGQERFFRAMLQVGQHNPPLHLLLLGGPTDDQYARSIQAIAAEAGATDRLHLTGAVKSPERYYGAVDVAVNSRIDAEPFGLSVIEAMMMERPVLIHALGGPAETVIDGKTGWHVSSPDVESFAQGIRRALDDRPRWAEMGRQARQHALEHFSIELQVENYMSHVQRILAERSER